jgi:phosphoglycerate dehydrogenase-like enzyme
VVRARDFARLVTPALRWVQSCSAGVEHLIPALDPSVTITNSSGVHANAIAESVMAAVLLHAKRLRDRLDRQARAEWEPLHCVELLDRTICTIGTGDIGASVARLAKAFGMRVLGVRRTPAGVANFDAVVGPSELRQVLAQADYVVVACPLTRETEGLVGRTEFQAIKPGAYFINVARGRIVDEPSLLHALEDGRLSGAFLDAHVQEPLPADHPFWTAPTVTVIPHDSHSSERIGDNTLDLFASNLSRYVQGQPLHNVIDRARGY